MDVRIHEVERNTADLNVIEFGMDTPVRQTISGRQSHRNNDLFAVSIKSSSSRYFGKPHLCVNGILVAIRGDDLFEVTLGV